MELELGPEFSRQFHQGEVWKNLVTWKGVSCWKCPLDLWSYQQIIYETRPEVIVECGVAMGGTTLYLADMLELTGQGTVLGIDLDFNWLHASVREHPRVELIQGSSVDPKILERVRKFIGDKRTMVILDSDHWVSHDQNRE